MILSLTINFIGFIQSLFLGSILCLKKSKKRNSDIIAACLLMVISIFILNSLRILSGNECNHLWFEDVSNFAVILLGPLLYVMTVCEISPRKYNRKMVVHFLPFSILFFVFLSAKYVFNFSQGIIDGIGALSAIWMIGSLFIYMGVSIKKAVTHRKILRRSFLLSLIGISLIWHVNLGFQWAHIFFDDQQINLQIVCTLFLSVLVVGLCYQNWIELLHAKLKVGKPMQLKKRDAEAYAAKVSNEFNESEPFLNPDYKLVDLSRKLNIPTSYLSKAINESFGMGFRDLLAKHRVGKVISFFESGEYDHFTLLGIAREAGFKSSSTFNLAFKKQTGMLPSEYRKALIKA